MARLTDKTLAQSTAITPTTLIHIVFTGDPSQNPDGSSFKAELQQLTSIFSGSTFTGGTVNSQTNFIGGLSANTFSATTIDLCGSNGTLYTSSISGCSPINMLSPVVFPQGISATTITINNNSISADTFVTGVTFNNSNYNLSLSRNDGVTLTSSLSILASDLRVTGGTYNSSTGTATFTNNTGGTFNVTGFLTGFTDLNITGGTYNSSTGTATFTNNTGGTFNVTGFYTGATDVFITGASYSNNNFTYTNSTGGSISVLFDDVSGLTSNGTISSQSITANTVSANTLTVSGITVNPKQLIALFFGHDSLNPGDTQTYYIGNSINLTAPISGSDGRRVIVPKTGNIVRVGICQTVGGALGTNETSTFTINNFTQSTQSTITTTYTYDSSSANISYVLSSPLAVTEGDKIEIRWTTPTWVTNPTSVRQQMNVYLEY